VLPSRNVVAAILVQLERHSRHPEVKKGSALLRWARCRSYRRSMHHADSR
jgi:hypothetical protein